MKYIYLHIPKNGGTTLQSILDQQYKPHQIYNIPDTRRDIQLQKLKRLNWFSKSRIKVVKGGHFNYGCHEYFRKTDKVNYFTILREPISRALSYYNYVMRTPEHYLFSDLNANNIDFEAFINNDQLNMEIANGQTKMLAGIDQELPCTEQNFQNAKLHLKENFVLVGILDYYLETLYFLSKIMGWKQPIRYKILNRTTETINELSPSTIDKLNGLNDYDSYLYDFYLKNFQLQMSQMDVGEFGNFRESLIY